MGNRVSIRQVTSSVAVIGAVLGLAACSANTGQHAVPAATVSRSRTPSSAPVGCGFGTRPATASQRAGFADARFAWAARQGLDGFQRRAFFRIAIFDLQAGIVNANGAAAADGQQAYRKAVAGLREVVRVFARRPVHKTAAYLTAVAYLNRFFGKARLPTYFMAPSRLDRGCGSSVLPVPGRQRAGYDDARHAWGVSNSPVGDVGGAGQGVFWGVAKYDLKAGLEYDRLTEGGRRAYRQALRAIRNMSSLPDTELTRRETAENARDLHRINHFFGTRGYV